MKLKAKHVFLTLLLSVTAMQVCADNVFTHAILKLPFEVQEEAPWSRIITSQEQWQQFYDENKTYNSVTPTYFEAPPIDFELYTIVVGGLDWRYSHTDIVVQRVSTNSNSSFLSVALLSPGSSCVVTANITYPNIAVLLPKPAGELTIYTREYVYECPV